MARPNAALRLVLGDRLHPGGDAATERLLEQAHVGPGTRFVDIGCGAGHAVRLARKRGANAIGLDRSDEAACTVNGELTHLPFAAGAFEVAFAECVLCLAEDVDRALAEAHRVLAPGGLLALSDVVVEGALAPLPGPFAAALCLDGERRPGHLRTAVERAGFHVSIEEDRTDDLLAMRETVRSRLDYEGLLRALGPRGEPLLAATHAIDAALDAGRLRYVALVAERRP